ncbi:MAG: hydroxymethylglutaryl-CoA lyase [Patiriisocius sp.]
MNAPKIIECPRDAMQGIHDFIPTEVKIDYINLLLQCGFDTLDFGSFVSPRAIPQLRDTVEVLSKLNLDDTETKLLAIVGNLRGANRAADFDEIKYLGFPYSISEEFLRRNINSSKKDSLQRIEKIQEICVRSNKELVVYISMGFGNPYGEDWNVEIVADACRELYKDLGIKIISLSDTIGTSNPESIKYLFSNLIPELTDVEFGAHLHTTPDLWEEKVKAALDSGCQRFDGALKGYGGCPMAKDELTGNMATENIIQCLDDVKIPHNIDMEALQRAMLNSTKVFL